MTRPPLLEEKPSAPAWRMCGRWSSLEADDAMASAPPVARGIRVERVLIWTP
jgi:hypothetical protein